MPRRRGEYSLTKSTSFAVFPVADCIDKSCCSRKNNGQSTCKAKIRLNITVGDSCDFDFLTREAHGEFPQCEEVPQLQKHQQRSTSHWDLLQLFSKDVSKSRILSRNHLYVGAQYRATSHDSSFRSPLKCSRNKFLATGKKQDKETVKPAVKVLSFVNLARQAIAQQNDVSTRRDFTKPRKIRKSKSDAFVNSQEWTLSQGVAEFKLGLVGSLHSGKTSLVHRYLTGAYTNEESPEGGRFKKEVVLEGQSYLLLIRDEGSAAPDYQFAQWVDAVIFVFSLESQESIETSLRYYEQMAKYRNISEVPVLMVGTQDAVTESSPRVISEQEGRQLVKSLPKCSGYYEACSTYGLNVDRVFKDACQKILQQRIRLLSGFSNSAKIPTPTAPSTLHSNGSSDHRNSNYQDLGCPSGHGSKGAPYHHQRSVSALPLQDHSQSQHSGRHGNGIAAPLSSSCAYRRESSTLSAGTAHLQCSPRASNINPAQVDQTHFLRDEIFDSHIPLQAPSGPTTSTGHLLTPSSTPTTQRKNRRISNLFQRPKDHGHEEKSHRSTIDINMGMGRAIPVKQGHLYKRSSKSLNKEWKKKYVCLHSDGRLSYHQTLKEYMEKDANGKEVFLGLATVRVAGRQRPRNTHRTQTQAIPAPNRDLQNTKNVSYKRESLDPSVARHTIGVASTSDASASTGQDNKAFTDEQCTNGEGTSGGSDDQQQGALPLATSTSSSIVGTPANVSSSVNKKKKGHRRLGSAAKNEEEDDCEFEIVTCDQKRWEFSATSVEERDDWVAAIEELIEKSLQAQMSQKQQSNGRAHGNKAEVQALRQISGNGYCADCGSAKPDWASLNLGTLICIECSGIHRNLGSHISKVRSLDLDDWPMEYLTVMEAIGNEKANAVWEHNAPCGKKPQAGSSRVEKEKWIKVKYEGKRFLPTLAADQPLGRLLLDAVFNNDLSAMLPILPRCTAADLRTTVDSTDKRTALHIACSNASAACTQLLVWYNADLRVLDEMGRSALWHAQTSGALDCASILINAGLDPNHGIPNGSEMISGSLSSREFCAPGEKFLKSDAKLRRQSDIVVRRMSPGQLNSTPNVNGFHQRASDAFERLPASVI